MGQRENMHSSHGESTSLILVSFKSVYQYYIFHLQFSGLCKKLQQTSKVVFRVWNQLSEDLKENGKNAFISLILTDGR